MSQSSGLYPGPDNLVHTSMHPRNKHLNSALSSVLGIKDQAKNSALEELPGLEKFSYDHILLNDLLIPFSLQPIIHTITK